jgi:purine-binding chemotaxis protein CheW
MSSARTLLEPRLAEMRRLFDDAFAQPLPERGTARQPMLAIVAGGESLAVRLADIAALATARGSVVQVPSSVPELIGVTGIRGTLVPVFSLAALLGLERRSGEARWLLLCNARQLSLALAFEQFQEHIQVDAADVFAADAADRMGGYLSQSVRHGDRLRALVNVPAIVEHITGRGVAATAATK